MMIAFAESRIYGPRLLLLMKSCASDRLRVASEVDPVDHVDGTGQIWILYEDVR